MLEAFPCVKRTPRTGALDEDVRRFLQENGCPRTCAHVFAVSDACAELAARFSLPEAPCRTAALLHDVGAVIRRADMLPWFEQNNLPLCEAERAYPFLLHQRLSACIAREQFGVRDPSILTAVACHSTLRAQASALDMALFLADKIAWDQPGEPPYLPGLKEALENSLPAACRFYMEYTVASGRLLCPHADWTAALRWLSQDEPSNPV